MRIAINTRLLIKNKLDGIGRFSIEILKRITIQNPKIEFHFIFDRPFSSEFIFFGLLSYFLVGGDIILSLLP